MLVVVMYISLGMFLIAPLFASGVKHKRSIRRRSAALWFLSSGGLCFLYLSRQPDLTSLTEAIVANIIAAVILQFGDAFFRRKKDEDE